MCEMCPPKGRKLGDNEVKALLQKLAQADLSDPHIVKLMDRLLGTETGPNLDREYGRAWEEGYRNETEQAT